MSGYNIRSAAFVLVVFLFLNHNSLRENSTSAFIWHFCFSSPCHFKIPDNIQGIAGGLAEEAGNSPRQHPLDRLRAPVSASLAIDGRFLKLNT